MSKLLVIFICQKRYEYFRLLEVFNASKHKFVAILQEGASFQLSEEEKSVFSRVVYVDKLNEEFLMNFVEMEMQTGTPAGKIRIVCLDEIRLLLAAKVREKYAIPGERVEALQPFRNKLLMKEVLARANICVPLFFKICKEHLSLSAEDLFVLIKDRVGLPFILKPVAGASSLGVELINELAEFQVWQKNYAGVEEYEAEEFIQGDLYHCDSFIRNGEIEFVSVGKYTVPCLEFTKGKPLGMFPLPHFLPEVKEVMEFNNKVLDAMSLKNGVTHLEVFRRPAEKSMVFVEIAARPSGGPVVKLIEDTFGVNLYKLSLQLELGESCEVTCETPNVFHAACYLPLLKGRVTNLNQPELLSEHRIDWEVCPGEKITSDCTSVVARRAGIVWLQGDYLQVAKDFDYLKSFSAAVYDVDMVK